MDLITTASYFGQLAEGCSLAVDTTTMFISMSLMPVLVDFPCVSVAVAAHVAYQVHLSRMLLS